MKFLFWTIPSRKKAYECRSRDFTYLKDEIDDMKNLYSRIEKLMDEKHPFLDGDFSIGDLAKLVFRNKAFVSRTINKIANVNFRAYINSYRARYAAALILREPRMKMSEVASQSGYNSIPTFNSSFKDEFNMRPSEYWSYARKHPELSFPMRREVRP